MPERCLRIPALQAKAGMLARSAASFEHPSARECCAAARWVWARMAASYRARHAYYCQHIEQVAMGGGEGAGRGCPPAPARPPAFTRLAPSLFPFHGPASSPHHHQGTPFPASPQIKVELAAAEARRQPVLVAQPALHLDLPAALQQPPPRVDMCSVCGRWIEQVGRWGAGCVVAMVSWRVWYAVGQDSAACALVSICSLPSTPPTTTSTSIPFADGAG